ncbi:MAG: dihydroorotase [Provencibacterium sp.]|jgi:dihydroorotase|nr:dihydroorotase [Provencibacterium sp.]
MRILIQNGWVIDPASGFSGQADLLLEDGKVAALGPSIPAEADLTYNARGKLTVPGLVDMHVHLRDPGQTHKEDIITGTAAAAAGGVTSVCCMPNTTPAADSPEIIAAMLERAKWGSARVYPCAAFSRALAGKETNDYPALRRAGAVAVSDDGRPVEDTALLEKGAAEAAEAGLLTISHCEDLKIIDGGIIHKGAVSEALGVRGMDRRSEDESTAREIASARRTGRHIHIAHVSTAGSVELIRRAKAEGVPISGETGPHYFSLTDRELLRRDANFRMNPPLREESDRLAVIEGLRDGTLDAIATDHAPHTPEEKADFLHAPNGIIGLETSFMVSYTRLVRGGFLSLERLVALMSLSPARLLGIPGGTLKPGAPADVAVFDLETERTLCAQSLLSKSRNSPFLGNRFYGACMLTICGGRIVYSGLLEASAAPLQ